MIAMRELTGYTWLVTPAASGLAIGAAASNGETAAQGTLTFRSITPTEHRASFEATVVPGHLRKGLGAALMAWAEAAARANYAANLRVGETVQFRAEADTPTDGAVALYRSAGLELAVAEDEMTRTLEDLPRCDIPANLCVLSWGAMTAPLFYHAYDAAFRDRPGFPGWDEQRWRAAFTAADAFVPESSMVIMDGPEPAAFAVLWEEGETGWITQMGVRPGWRGQGLGEFMLTRALRSFARRGLMTAALEVATNNPHARRLYERMGFGVAHSWQSWQKQL